MWNESKTNCTCRDWNEFRSPSSQSVESYKAYTHQKTQHFKVHGFVSYYFIFFCSTLNSNKHFGTRISCRMIVKIFRVAQSKVHTDYYFLFLFFFHFAPIFLKNKTDDDDDDVLNKLMDVINEKRVTFSNFLIFFLLFDIISECRRCCLHCCNCHRLSMSWNFCLTQNRFHRMKIKWQSSKKKDCFYNHTCRRAAATASSTQLVFNLKLRKNNNNSNGNGL